jgi:hypothetical protein
MAAASNKLGIRLPMARHACHTSDKVGGSTITVSTTLQILCTSPESNQDTNEDMAISAPPHFLERFLPRATWLKNADLSVSSAYSLLRKKFWHIVLDRSRFQYALQKTCYKSMPQFFCLLQEKLLL